MHLINCSQLPVTIASSVIQPYLFPEGRGAVVLVPLGLVERHLKATHVPRIGTETPTDCLVMLGQAKHLMKYSKLLYN